MMIFCKPWAEPITNNDGTSGIDSEDSILASSKASKHTQDTYEIARMQTLLGELTFGMDDNMIEAGALLPLKKRRSKNRRRHHHHNNKKKKSRSPNSNTQQQQMEGRSPPGEDRMSGSDRQTQSQYQQEQQGNSPTKATTSLQTVWKTAIDPTSGRTYYYDSVSRRTQWDKPAEIKAMERAKRKEKRRLDKVFFAEMEQNIYDTLARGELTTDSNTNPITEKCNQHHQQQNNQSYTKQQQKQQQDDCSHMMSSSPPKANPQRRSITQQRVRTISGMDEMLLNELSVDQPDRAGGIPVARPETKKPELVSRGRSVPSSCNETNSLMPPRGRPPRAPDNINPSLSSSRCGYSTGLDSMELSPEPDDPERKNGIVTRQESELAGEHLLDSPFPTTSGNHNSAGRDPPKDNVVDNADGQQQQPLPRPTPVHIRRNTGGTIHFQSTMTNPNVEATIKCVCGVFRAHILQALGKRNQRSYLTQPHLAEIIPVFNDFSTPISTGRRHHQQQQPQKKVPSLDEIFKFYQDFYKRSQMEHDTIIMSLIYVERLVKETHGALSPTPQNWMSFLFSCMVMASKVWDDLSMWNIDFSNVCGRHGRKNIAFASFTLKRINQLEVAVLKALNFCVKVPASEYAKYYFLIRSMLIKSGLLDESSHARPNTAASRSNNSDSGDYSGGRPHPPPQQQQQQSLDMQGAKNLETLSTNYQDAFQVQHNRRAKSMDGFFGFFAAQQEQVAGSSSGAASQMNCNPESSSDSDSGAGPVLKQSVCLEQLVSMQ